MKRKTLLFVVVILVLAVAGLFAWQRSSATTTTVKYQTATASRGTLTASVSAAGNVTAPIIASVAYTTTGKVTQAPFRVGDSVKKGDLIMQLDTTDLTLDLKTAEVALSSQQASFESSQATLQYAIDTAQSNLNSAQASYDSALATNSTHNDQLIVAKAALDKARVTLQSAQAAYDVVAWRPDIGMLSQSTTLQTATSDYQSALSTYKITAAGVNDTALRTAQASVDNAKTSLAQAQKNLDTSMRTAQASLDNAQNTVDQAKQNIVAASLYAPFDGVISVMNYAVGDSASGTVATIVDLSKLQVKVTVAEVDIAKIKVGQKATMTADAVSGATYTATVAYMGPVGTVTSGVVNFTVVLDVDNPDGTLRPGMTANLGIITEKTENVLLVPSRCVSTKNSQKTVSVIRQGKAVQTPVTVGVSNDTMVEIKSGLSEGDIVVVNTTTTTSSGGGPGGGMMMIGGGGPPP